VCRPAGDRPLRAPGGPSGRSWIAIMNADGFGQRRLPHTDGSEYPSWSPDGRSILFASHRDHPDKLRDIYVGVDSSLTIRCPPHFSWVRHMAAGSGPQWHMEAVSKPERPFRYSAFCDLAPEPPSIHSRYEPRTVASSKLTGSWS